MRGARENMVVWVSPPQEGTGDKSYPLMKRMEGATKG